MSIMKTLDCSVTNASHWRLNVQQSSVITRDNEHGYIRYRIYRANAVIYFFHFLSTLFHISLSSCISELGNNEWKSGHIRFRENLRISQVCAKFIVYPGDLGPNTRSGYPASGSESLTIQYWTKSWSDFQPMSIYITIKATSDRKLSL